FFFVHVTSPSAFSTLSLHDALPICACERRQARRREGGRVRERVVARADVGGIPVAGHRCPARHARPRPGEGPPGNTGGSLQGARDRKSTRLNSSHSQISYAVFCLKK